MILMLAPGPNMAFGAMPSGASYVSDDHALIQITNNSAADQLALQEAGCFTLTPFGSWGTYVFSTLSDLYAADSASGLVLPGQIGFPVFTAAAVFNDSGNTGTWAKTSDGAGSGNWTQVSTLSLMTLANSVTAAASSAESAAASETSALASKDAAQTAQAGAAASALSVPAKYYVSIAAALADTGLTVGQLFCTDASGQLLFYTRTGSSPYYTQTSMSAAAVTFAPAGSGAASRSQQSKLRDVISVSDFDSNQDGTVTAAEVANALTAAGQGGQLLVPIESGLGTTEPTNPGAVLTGSKRLYTTPTATGSLGNPGGRKVFNKVGRDDALMQWGYEALGPVFLKRLQAAQSYTVVLIGDSNTASYSGPLLVGLLYSLPGTPTIINNGVSGSTYEHWRTNTGPVSGTGKDMASTMALGPHLLVDLYGGTNDAFYSGSIASFEASKRAGYAAIRASYTVQQLSIAMVTAGPMNEGVAYSGTTEMRDEMWNAKARPVIQQLAKDFEAAFIDKNARVPNAFHDFIAGASQNSNLDNNRVHSQPWLSASLAQWVYEGLVPSGLRTPTVTNAPGSYLTKAATDTPASYPVGVSVLRATTGFPVNGFVYTIRSLDGAFPLQFNYGFNGETDLYFRMSSGASPGTWGPWLKNTTNISGAVLTRAATDTPASYPNDLSIYRATTGFPINGFVYTIKSVDNAYPIQFNYGFSGETQIYFRMSSGSSPGTWGAWQLLGMFRVGLVAQGGTLGSGYSDGVGIENMTCTATGNDVQLSGYISKASGAVAAGDTLCTIPSGWRPPTGRVFDIVVATYDGTTTREVLPALVDAAGVVKLAKSSTSSTITRVYFNARFPRV